MLELRGQYIFDLVVADYHDFLQSSDLIEFTLIEETGNCLPSFDLKFQFTIDDLRSYLVENNPLLVKFGVSRDDMEDIPLVIFSKDVYRIDNTRWRADISGFYNATGFLSGDKITSYSNKGVGIPATSALQTCVGKYFSFDTNITKSSDRQVWLQEEETDRSFTCKAWLHSYLPNSFPSVAITADGRYLYRDMMKAFAQRPAYTFVNYNSSNSNYLTYSGKLESESDIGFFNDYAGYGKSKRVYNMITGQTEDISVNLKPVLALTDNLEKNSLVQGSQDLDCHINDNVDPHYWSAYFNNVNNLMFFSSVKLRATFKGKMIDVSPLDIITVMDKGNTGANEGYYSGKYIVDKVVRSIQGFDVFSTFVTLSRESFNEIRDKQKEESVQPIMVKSSNSNLDVATNKLNTVNSNVTATLQARNIPLFVPPQKIITSTDYLNQFMQGMVGFNNKVVMMKAEYINNNPTASIEQTLMSLTYQYFSMRGITALPLGLNISTVLSAIQTGNPNLLIGNYLTIPGIGSVSTLSNTAMTGDFFSRWASGLLDQFIHGGIKTGIPEIDSLVTLMATLFTSGSYLVNSTSSLFSSLGYTPISWSDQNVVAVLESDPKVISSSINTTSTYQTVGDITTVTNPNNSILLGSNGGTKPVIVNLPNITTLNTSDPFVIDKLHSLYVAGSLGNGTNIDTGSDSLNAVVANVVKYFQSNNMVVGLTPNVSSELILDGNIDIQQNTVWNLGNGWTYDYMNRQITHTSGSSDPLQQNINTKSGAKYLLTFWIKNKTAGTLNIQLGDAVIQGLSSNTRYNIILEPEATGNLQFIPSVMFNGSIQKVSMQEVAS